ETTQEILKVSLGVDKSPGIIEVHVNEDIIFVEITEGLNRDKLSLLGLKITELVKLYEIKVPKVIIMLSNIKLGFYDSPNLKKLMENVIPTSGAKPANIRILTNDEFVKKFIEAEKEYGQIEVVNNLQLALDGLMAGLGKAEAEDYKAEFIGDKILSAEKAKEETVQLRFDGEIRISTFDVKESLKGLHIATVDDDEIITGLIKHTFNGFDVNLSIFSNGAEFISLLGKENFDLVLLDMIMPRADGFAVLREIKDRNINVPVIVLSSVSQQETIIRAFQMGIKSYLVKPLKPSNIFKKALEILKVNF
ncbi:MAG: response regulator, partial [Treponema sp.]|nr:response regulator [Treponema sp.]